MTGRSRFERFPTELTFFQVAEHTDCEANLVRDVRRRIVTRAAQAFVSGRIDATAYQHRIDRANVTGADAPYYSLRTGR